ncbi:MAG: cytochrome P460 family protein [Nitrospirae bacterium]|nr:cytochrome P460 family protein [Nitrospirota bacterium]
MRAGIKFPILLSAVIAAGFILASCSDEDEPNASPGELPTSAETPTASTGLGPTGTDSSSTTTAPSSPTKPTAEALWARLLEADPPANWKLLPGYEWPRLGTSSAHGLGVENVYVNPESEAAIQPGLTGPMPNGTTIVKYIYANKDPAGKGELKIVAAIQKGEGFNPEAGDWVWVEFNGTGRVVAQQSSGKSGSCTSCHSGAQRDFIWLAK